MKNFKNPYLEYDVHFSQANNEPKNPYLQHGWGKTADAKRKEKEYNQKYYELHKKDKWGVGDHLKAFGSSVKESLQKHNDNWQSGMDTILRKNVTQQPSAVAKKKVNPYNATGMAANEAAKAAASAKQYRQATAAQRRAQAMAGNEQARANEAAKAYRKANASVNRAKAEADSKKAAQDLQNFKNEQRKNAEKIAEMHKEFERIQTEMKRAKEKQAQSDYKDASMERIRDTNIVKRASDWKSKCDQAAAVWSAQVANYNANANVALGMYNSTLPIDPGVAANYYSQYTAYLSAADEATATYNAILEESKRMDDMIASANQNKSVMADYMKDPSSYDVKDHQYTKKKSK